MQKKSWFQIILACLGILIVIAIVYLYNAKQSEITPYEDFVQHNPDFVTDAEADIAEIRSLLEKTPNDPELWHSLGMRYYALGKFQTARDALNQAIFIDSNYYLSYSALGDVARDMGDLVVAEESYKKALSRNPAYPNIYIKMSDFYRSQNRAKDAEDTYIVGIQNTNNSFLMKRYANFLEEAGRYQEAIDYWNLALPLEPENTDGINAEIERLKKEMETAQ